MMIQREYVCRAYPNEEQKSLFEKIFGAVRLVHNELLWRWHADCRMDFLEELNFIEKEKPWLELLDQSILIYTARQLQEECTSALLTGDKGCGGENLPHFKHAGDLYCSFTVSGEGIRIRDEKLRVDRESGFFPLSVAGTRRVPLHSKIIRVRIVRKPPQRYFVVLALTIQVPDHIFSEGNRSLTLVFDEGAFFLASDPSLVTDPSYIQRIRKKKAQLERESLQLVRMESGSNNALKQKILIEKIKMDIFRMQQDYVHKLSHIIAEEYDIVFVQQEEPQTQSQEWSLLIRMLKYKLRDCGKNLIFVPRDSVIFSGIIQEPETKREYSLRL